MGWIKRNLFFVIGGVVALVLLGAAGFYVLKEWQRNTTAFTHLNEVYTSLKKNSITDKDGKPLSPGNDKVDNIAAARDQERQLRQWMSRTTNFFQPIPRIPNPANGRITDSMFANALHDTFDKLRAAAAAANVTVPQDPPFYFSFTAEQDRVTFARGSLEPLSVQLGEVNAVMDVLFAAGINALDSVGRIPVSPDDTTAAGGQADYLNGQSVTNGLAVLTPYQVTFRAFSPEIARVLEGFANSPHGFIVKDLSVQPANAPTVAGGYQNQNAIQNPNAYFNPNTPAGQQAAARRAYLAAAGAAPQPGRGGLQTILSEQELSVTLTVEVVKLTPRK